MDFLTETPPAPATEQPSQLNNVITVEAPAPATNKNGTPKKDGRGRPRKIKAADEKTPAQPAPVNDEDKLRAKLADFQRNPAPEVTASPEAIQAEVQKQMPVITGRVFIELIDFLCPRLIKFVYTFFEENARYLDIQDIKLSSLQKSELTEVADEVAKIVFAEVPPHYALIVMISIAYFTNTDDAMIKANEKAAKEAERKRKEDEKKRPKLDISPDE